METCWTLIRGAAANCERDREEFVQRYLPVVRAYLAARWRGTPLTSELDDTVQEVFVACFRDGGALESAEERRKGGFRAFLYGVTKNTALHVERDRGRRLRIQRHGSYDLDGAPDREESLSRAFDRAYAVAILRDARERMTSTLEERGPEDARRAELLRLRFEEGLPIRAIAERWGADSRKLHRDYERAREEFRRALRETVAENERCPASRLDEECERLLRLLRR